MLQSFRPLLVLRHKKHVDFMIAFRDWYMEHYIISHVLDAERCGILWIEARASQSCFLLNILNMVSWDDQRCLFTFHFKVCHFTRTKNTTETFYNSVINRFRFRGETSRATQMASHINKWAHITPIIRRLW